MGVKLAEAAIWGMLIYVGLCSIIWIVMLALLIVLAPLSIGGGLGH